MKATIKLGLVLGALCGLNNLNADVPHVFEDGEVIRAEEMNENFSSINSEITTIKTDVENNSNNKSSWSEDYTYSVKNLTPGRDRVTVLGELYDIIQFDTVSFNDHSLVTIKFPLPVDYYSQPRSKALDIHRNESWYTTERRNHEDAQPSFTNTVSGYPAEILAYVANNHEMSWGNSSQMTRAEFDAAEYTEYFFSGSGYIRLRYVDVNPYNENSDDPETNYFNCDADWSDIYAGGNWTWNPASGTSDEESITSIDAFNGILSACKAAESELFATKQRVRKYFVYTDIQIGVNIALDAHTLFRLWFRFDEKDYQSDLGVNCDQFSDTSQAFHDCVATVAPADRNFVDDINVKVQLPVKSKREEYINQLFTLIDHIVISGSDSES
jgi:hypothetical protein